MADSLRFNSSEYVDAYRRTGQFPKIHDDLTSMVSNLAVGRRFLDLCCSTGLLAIRLTVAPVAAEFVVGVDRDREALTKAGRLARGNESGIAFPWLEITPATLPALRAIMRSYSLNVVVARRCLPELATSGGRDFVLELAEMFKAGGVKEMFVEGRVVSERSNHALKSVQDEVAALWPAFTLHKLIGRCAYLRAEG